MPSGVRFFFKTSYGFYHQALQEGRKLVVSRGQPQSLDDDSQPWGLKGKVASLKTEGLCEEWDWRRLLFEGREANPPESTGVWLCYSHGFPSLISIPLCMHWVTLVIAFWTSWGEWWRQLLSALRASVTGVMEGGNEMPVCWGKTSEEEENLFAEVFPLIPSFLQYSSSLLGSVFHIAVALRLIRLWIVVCMLIRIYCFLPLKWTKTLPLGIFNLEKSTLFPLCLPLPFPKHFFVLWGVAADPLCSLCSLFPLLPEV